MKKKILTLGTALVMTMAMGITSFAGWQLDSTGWWWQNNDGSWPANTWQWIDGNGDGTAECYYFNEAGYMLANTTTPDGYTVNADGAWVVNGAVQTQGAAAAASTRTQNEAAGDYCRDINGKYGSSTAVFAEQAVDRGSYYELKADVYAEYPEGGMDVPYFSTIIRIRKSATVYWHGYNPEEGDTGSWELTLEEYANLFNEGSSIKPLSYANLYHIEQDSEGYVVAFTDYNAG